MAKVQRVMRAGLSFPLAARSVLEQDAGGVTGVAKRHGVNRTALSALLGGSARSPYIREREVLALELGVTRKWLDNELQRAAQS